MCLGDSVLGARTILGVVKAGVFDKRSRRIETRFGVRGERVRRDDCDVVPKPLPACEAVEPGDDQLSISRLERQSLFVVELVGPEPRVELVDHRQSAGVARSDEVSNELRLSLEVFERRVLG